MDWDSNEFLSKGRKKGNELFSSSSIILLVRLLRGRWRRLRRPYTRTIDWGLALHHRRSSAHIRDKDDVTYHVLREMLEDEIRRESEIESVLTVYGK